MIGLRGQRRLELLPGALGTAQIEVDVREIEPRRHQPRIEIQRLAQLRFRLADHLGQSLHAIRDPQQHVGLRRSGIGREDLFQLVDGFLDAIGAREQRRADAIDPLLDRGPGIRLLRQQRPAWPEDQPCGTQQSRAGTEENTHRSRNVTASTARDSWSA